MTRAARTAAAALLVAALAGCTDDPPQVVATATCAAPERPPLQGGSHLVGDAEPPVPYSSTPPTSGWHASGNGPAPGIHEQPVPDPLLVSALEQGAVVVTHGAPLTPDQQTVASSLVAELDGVVVTPHELRPGDPPFAVAAWGVLQRCETLDPEAVATFAAAYGGQDREP